MKKVFCGIRLKQETIDNFKQLANEKRRKTSDLMRIVLENYIETVKDV